MIEALKMQGWLPDYDKPRDLESGELKGGVLTPGWFNIEVVFSTFDDFEAAEEEFRFATKAIRSSWWLMRSMNVRLTQRSR